MANDTKIFDDVPIKTITKKNNSFVYVLGDARNSYVKYEFKKFNINL